MIKGYSKIDNEFARKWCKKLMAIKHLGDRCKKCHNVNPVHLEFHHLISDKKENDISTMLNKSFSWDNIKKEIDNCILLGGFKKTPTSSVLGMN